VLIFCPSGRFSASLVKNLLDGCQKLSAGASVLARVLSVANIFIPSTLLRKSFLSTLGFYFSPDAIHEKILFLLPYHNPLPVYFFFASSEKLHERAKENFSEEMQSFLEETHEKEADKIMPEFTKAWTSPQFLPAWQEAVMRTSKCHAAQTDESIP